MRRYPSILTVALCACAAWPAAPAAAQEAPRFDLSGYGTLGVVRSDERRADYVVDVFRPDGPGFSREWSPEVDSRLGLQLSAVFGPRLSAVVQVLSEQRYDDTFTPVVEWANAKYQATPELALRAGRIVLPMFLVTDTRKVGYANPWVRPPVEVYSLVPVTNSDGFDASYRFAMGAATNIVHASLGRTEPRFPSSSGGSGKARAKELLVLVDTLERGPATARLSYGRAALTVDSFDPLFEGFRRFGAAGAAVAERNEVRDRDVWFVGLGVTYDPGRWFATAEWAKFDTRSVLGAKSGWYASAGYRIGAFTPYATYARSRDEGRRSDPGLDLSLIPAPLRPTAAALNAALNRQLSGDSSQSTISAGVRWDFARSAALKLQYDQVRLAAGSGGVFRNTQPGFQRGGNVGIFSAAVDVVF